MKVALRITTFAVAIEKIKMKLSETEINNWLDSRLTEYQPYFTEREQLPYSIMDSQARRERIDQAAEAFDCSIPEAIKEIGRWQQQIGGPVLSSIKKHGL